MRDLLKSLNNSLESALQWAGAKATLVFAPLANAFLKFTAPFWAWWARFRKRYPVAGGVLKGISIFFASVIYLILLLIFGVWIGFFGRLPSTDELKNIETANSTEIYTADSVLIGRFYRGENRTEVTLDNVSPHIINALIATEDRRFLEHSGIDIKSWLRVGYGLLSGEGLGGGSTLSQQLAKNLFPRKEYLYVKIRNSKYRIPFVSNAFSLIVNKIRENFISVRLERVYNKQEILNLYLNTVPFGGDVYGVNVASRQYFNKKPKDLAVDQAATLIGMLQGTTIYHPVRRPENAQRRRNEVLVKMVKNGHLTQAEYEELSKKPVGAKNYNVDSNNEGTGTYFREYLRTDVMPKLLEKYKKGEDEKYNLYTDGLKIYTTLHSTMQQYAEEAVQKHMQDLQKQFDQHWKNYKKEKPWGDDKWILEWVKKSERWEIYKEAGLNEEQALAEFEKPAKMTLFSWKNGGSEVDTTMTPLDSVRYYFCMLNCGFMAMDHRNGYVRAWVGGINFKHFKLDHIKTSRQVGSTFKPIVYAAALQDSVRPCDYFPNEIKMIVDWEPHNADERYGGFYSVNGALTRSVNVVAAQLIEKVGIGHTIDLAAKMGVTSKLPREYGISLGAADISLFEMTKVYGTIANQGKRPEPVTVLRVLNRDGEVIYDYKEELAENPQIGSTVQALSPNHAAIMTKMLQNVIDHGTGGRLRYGYGIRGDFAGKTGTTQNQADGWFICFNPQLVTGAWVGAESPAVRFRSMSLGQGSAMALPIVAWFWHKMANDKKLGRLLTERFPPPKPEVLASFSCYSWISIPPDSLDMILNSAQDTSLRDSLIAFYTTPEDPENKKSDKPATPPGGEGGDDSKTPANKEEEKKPGIFKKLFGHKPEEEKDKKKQEKQEEKRQQ